MVREFKLPDLGEGIREGEIVQWLVDAGETVSEDQPVVEVETDKALVEIPSPVDGTVRDIRAEEGETVTVGEVIITFDVDGATAPGGNGAKAEVAGGDGAAIETETERPAGRVFAAPSARRLARELDVDIATIDGTGPGGRVTSEDVRAAAEGAAEDEGSVRDDGTRTVDEAGPTEPEAVPTTDDVERTTRERTLAVPAARRIAREAGIDINEVPATETRDGDAVVTPEAVRAFVADRRSGAEAAAGVATESGEERVPYRGIRRTIGDAMVRSAFTAPHVTHHDDADVTELVRIRDRLKPHAEERGARLTYLPFVMKAVVAGLEAYPYVNSSLDEEAEEIVLKDRYHIGVATATDRGLLVPIIPDVDRKGIVQLATEIEEMVGKARDRTISREEMQGGTFTITNFGAIGGEYATPIINPPEVAILGLGAIERRPRVVDDEVVPRPTLPLSLSIDHRVIDGAIGAAFVNEVKQYLEDPTLLLLE